MDDVIELDDHRPHVVTNDEITGTVTVSPLAMFQNFVDGKLSILDIEEADKTFRPIVRAWLESIT